MSSRPKSSRFVFVAAILVVGGGGGGCSSPRPVVSVPTDVSRLADWMSGSFTSFAQAMADPDHFLDVRLEMARIWRHRTDGAWLYVEQAVATALDRPYRQRIYRLHAPLEGGIRSVVYELPGDPLHYAGACRDPKKLDALAPEELKLRLGCELHLKRTGDREFRGSTLGNGCLSTLRGAHFATSNVRITPELVESWDRGFDHKGVQVWGAEIGPYVFLKR